MQSKAATVPEYLSELPPDRRAALEAVRDVINKNLDKRYEERMGYGMPGWAVPHSVYPPGYHCNPKQPLPFAGMASQKQHISVYLMSVYGGDEKWFRDAWAKTGKKLDMGKCCVRFKKIEDAALNVIGEAIRRMPVDKFIAQYEGMLAENGIKHPGKPKDANHSAAKPRAVTKSTKPAASKKASRKPAKKATKKNSVKR